MSDIKNLSDITKNGLCIGCGLCQSVVGKDKITISMTDKGRLEPQEVKPLSNENFDKIKKVCPGVLVCLLYTSPSPRDSSPSRMPSSA